MSKKVIGCLRFKEGETAYGEQNNEREMPVSEGLVNGIVKGRRHQGEILIRQSV